jgi:phage-related baseplate assembly protein
MAETFFEIPTDPEEFGVVLEPADLRRIDFSALEFQEMRRAIIEYIKTYHPTQFNDFVASNGIIMVMELVSYLADVLSQRSDVLVDESFLPTAQTVDAVDQHLVLINNEIKKATPAVVDIEVSIGSETPTAINVPAGLQFILTGPDGNPLTFELYRAPGDFTSPVTIFPGTRGIIGFGIEGKFIAPFTVESAGGPGQEIEILESNILDEPFFVTVQTGGIVEEWRRVDTLERAGPQDKVYEVKFKEDRAIVRFGNDKAGRSLLAGQIATVRFRVGGGSRGRISASAINETRPVNPNPPSRFSVEVLFRNPNPSSGGTDRETIEAAKLRAPKESAALSSATSGEDYAVQAKGFAHPIFGSVLKAVASVKTSLNANIVFLHILAEGPGGIPVLPSLGLKSGLETFLSDIKVLPSEVRVVDAAIKPVNLRANVVLYRSADPTFVKNEVDLAIQNFFDISKFDLGQPLYTSQLERVLQEIEGVKFIQLREPVDDIIQSKEGAVTAGDNQVGFDELITLGDVNVKFYFEKAVFN